MTAEAYTLPSKVAAIRPATEADWPAIWAILHERPEAHFDDTAGDTFEAFARELRSRLTRGESLWAVDCDGLAGAIGYLPITSRTGMLHGVCIARRVSGRGVADAALGQVLEHLRVEGIEKVSATYFSTNRHIRACLTRLGFKDEGFLQDQTTCGGVPMSLWLVSKLLDRN